MKNVLKNISPLFLFALIALSFNTFSEDGIAINTETSKVVWKGYKVTGSHEGLIQIKSGSLMFKEDVLTGGAITIDMTSIECTDLKGEYKEKLEGHLKSDDFFGVENHPTSSLVLTSVKSTGKNSYEATGDLTIKGIINPVIVAVSVYGNKANASLKIDRSKFDVKYGSTSFFDGLKDKAIYDEFDLVADFEF